VTQLAGYAVRSAAELDRALERWDEALGRSRTVLLELRGDSRWDLLNGPLRQVFTGATAAALEAACAATEDVAATLLLVEAVVAQARRLQPRLRILGFGQEIDDALALLEGPSIVLAVADLPLQERGLLGPASTTDAITPDAALARMAAGFKTASTAIAEIYAAWTEAGAARRRLLDEFDRLSADAPAALRAEILAFGDVAQTDPLADHRATADRLAARLAALRETAAEAAARRASVRQRLDAAAARLAALGPALDAAAAQCRAAEAVCIDALPSVPAIDAADLSAWLARLARRIDTADPMSVLAGLEAWTRPVAAAESGAAAARTAAQALLQRRDEARGRLMAVRRKARAVAGFGTDPDLQALADEAQRLLIGGRADVAAGEAALRRFERAVEQARAPLAQG
jgi:hypothetical protein